MTEYLIARETRGPLPDWQAGDAVMARPDGHPWGKREALSAWLAAGGDAAAYPGTFYVFRVSEHVWANTEAYSGSNVSWMGGGDPENPVTLALGRFNVALNELTADEAAVLASDYSLQLTSARMNALMLDRAANARLIDVLGA